MGGDVIGYALFTAAPAAAAVAKRIRKMNRPLERKERFSAQQQSSPILHIHARSQDVSNSARSQVTDRPSTLESSKIKILHEQIKLEKCFMPLSLSLKLVFRKFLLVKRRSRGVAD